MSEVKEEARKRRSINFGVDATGNGDAQWAALKKDAMGVMGQAGSFVTSGWLRVWFLALSRLEPSGHAPFPRQGELEELFTVDMVTGVQPAGAGESLDRAIRKAVKCGLLDKGSGRRCLIVPTRLAQTGKGRSNCPVHLWQ